MSEIGSEFSNGELAFDLLEDFIDNCAFIHDDWNWELAEADWDQYDTNPFLLGANLCVVSSLQGFGDDYLQFLDNLGLIPEHVIIPRKNSSRLTHNLLSDDAAIGKLHKLVADNRLDLSSFYSDPSQRLEELVQRVSGKHHQPQIHPPSASFLMANDKCRAWQLLTENGIPVPLGDICSSATEIISFFQYAQRHGYQMIVLKRGHRDHCLLSDQEDVFRLLSNQSYPVLVEAVYEVAASPVAQAISWKGKHCHLFSSAQEIVGFHFTGNSYPQRLSPNIELKIMDILHKLLGIFSQHSGVFGADFIVTPQQEVLAVDVNPRFNSSTYPFYFLISRAGMKRSLCARYQIVEDIAIPNLSYLLAAAEDMMCEPKLDRGILFFNPVIDFDVGLLSKFSYLAVGRNIEERRAIEHSFLKVVGRLREASL